MPEKKHTPKQAKMQAIINRLVPIVGELGEIQIEISKLTRDARTPHAVYATTFVDTAIDMADCAINAMTSQLGEKNLK